MGIITIIENDLESLVGYFGVEAKAIEAIIAANVKHDLEVIGAEAKALTKEALGSLWDVAKQDVASVWADPAFQNDLHQVKIDAAISLFLGNVSKGIVAAIPGIARTTAQAMVMFLAQGLVAGVLTL